MTPKPKSNLRHISKVQVVPVSKVVLIVLRYITSDSVKIRFVPLAGNDEHGSLNIFPILREHSA